MKRGFSLMETLLTLALAGVILSVTGQVLADYSRLSRQAQVRAEARDYVLQALQVLCRDLRTASNWNQPAPTQTGSTLVYMRWTADVNTWLTVPASGTWRPRPIEMVERVEVSVQNRELVARTAADRQVLATSVESFSVVRRDEPVLELNAVISEGERRFAVQATVSQVTEP